MHIDAGAMPFRRREFSTENCSLTRALEIVGERWTFLALREALVELRRFNDYHRAIGRARNVLAAQAAWPAVCLATARVSHNPVGSNRFSALSGLRKRVLSGDNRPGLGGLLGGGRPRMPLKFRTQLRDSRGM
jgi:hypothetical protein